MAEIRINATGGVKLYDADDSHYCQIVAGTISANVDILTLNSAGITVADGSIDFDIASHDTSNGLKLGGTLVSATAAELNIMDGVTATAAELNIMDGVTATAAELNIMDGVTATAAELNLIDGAVGVGKLGQVISTTKTDTFTSTSTSYVDVTGMSAAITPVATSSTILIIVSLNGGNATGSLASFYQLLRTTTPIGVGAAAGSRTVCSTYYSTDGNEYRLGSAGIVLYLDSPSTTSATTYKIQTLTEDCGTITFNRSGGDADDVTRGRMASTITLMEILA